MKETQKKIKIIAGNGEDLKISKVHDHLIVAKPKIKDTKNKKIIVPKEKKN